MNPRIAIAIVGGSVGVIGAVAISFVIYIVLWILTWTTDDGQTLSTIPFSLWTSVKKAHIYFPAGFISTWIVAPSAMRRIYSPRYKQTGFVTIGFLHGASAGLLCSWLAAFFFISQLTIFGITSGQVEKSLFWATKLFGYYTSSSMLLFGSLAATIGACVGSIAELLYRRFRHQQSNGLNQDTGPTPS